ncbi:hypothetical protein SAMN05216224_10348 [Thioclava dalianensis]|nr:hypothetical protein SAMN05216224_10348 [Thioclava dalianensis]
MNPMGAFLSRIHVAAFGKNMLRIASLTNATKP